MFPPRPSGGVRSSIPGSGNSQFPPPPAMRRERLDGFPSGGQYAAAANGEYPSLQPYGGDAARPIRSLSINTGQFLHQQQQQPSRSLAESAQGTSGGLGASALPSISNRNLFPQRPAGSIGSGPTMGQPRDGRSHTLDMGLFTDARRRKMNFQDILASAQPRAPLPNATPTNSGSMPGHRQQQLSLVSNTENVYPNTSGSYPAQKSYDMQG